MTTNCNFAYNTRAKSVVCFSQSSNYNKMSEYLYLQNSNFYRNKGVPIYLSNLNLHIKGNVKFHNNIAVNGGGIFVTNTSNVIFRKSTTVNFTNNRAINSEGAIIITNQSSVLFKVQPNNQYYNNQLHNTLSNKHSENQF